MKVLYIAYDCSPYNVSEDKIGWSIPWHIHRFVDEVHVITKIEQKPFIERFFADNNISDVNIKFHYLDIPMIYKKTFNNYFYSVRHILWQKKAFKYAKNIVKKEGIDVIHQITPVEIRSIGDYSKINNIKFFLGPCGGGEYAPKTLKKYFLKNFLVEAIRFVSNNIIIFKLKQKKFFYKIKKIYFVNEETKYAMRKLVKNIDNEFLIDIGLEKNDISTSNIIEEKLSTTKNTMIFLVSGRLIYRKGHAFLLKALSYIPENYNYKLNIIGDGKEKKNIIKLVKKYKLFDKVNILGKVPYNKINAYYNESDILIVPSLRETTGTVILEAFSKGVPVITSNHYGGSRIVNNKNGWIYNIDCGNPEKELSELIIKCIKNPLKVKEKSKNAYIDAYNYLWEKKVSIFLEDYKKD